MLLNLTNLRIHKTSTNERATVKQLYLCKGKPNLDLVPSCPPAPLLPVGGKSILFLKPSQLDDFAVSENDSTNFIGCPQRFENAPQIVSHTPATRQVMPIRSTYQTVLLDISMGRTRIYDRLPCHNCIKRRKYPAHAASFQAR